MKVMLIISMISLLITGCKSTDNATSLIIAGNNQPIYLDDAFPDHDKILIEHESEVFALDEEMQQMVRTKLAPIQNMRKRATKLLEQIFEAENIDLSYEGNANLTAIQTYHSKEANCISLTIMAYALAKEAKFEVSFQDIDVPEYWQRNGRYNMLTGHVNLVIKKERTPNIIMLGEDIIEIDFDPFVAKKSFAKKVVSKKTALAMFYNNKGAQALASGDLLTAYRYIKEATITAPSFSSAWGNLGIVYKRVGRVDDAKVAYKKAIFEDTNNNTALNNYAMLLRQTGNHKAAEEIELIVLKRRVSNPYYYALLANEAAYRGDFYNAISHYKKAIKLGNNIDELYVGLANIHYKQNNFLAAKNAMRKAISINKRKRLDEQYIAKLDMLKSKEVTYRSF